MTRMAVAWEVQAPPEFGDHMVWVVTEEACRRAEAERDELRSALGEAVRLMEDARGHYGIEETSGPGQPATEWDEIADEMHLFVHRWKEDDT